MPAAPLNVEAAPGGDPRVWERPAVELLLRVLAGACLGGLVVFAAVLLARRAAGAVGETLSPAALFCGGTMLASLAALAQWPHLNQLARQRVRRIHASDVLALGVPLAVAFLLAAAMTLPGASTRHALALWLPLIGSQAAIGWLWRKRIGIASPSPSAEEGSRMEDEGSRERSDAGVDAVADSQSSILKPQAASDSLAAASWGTNDETLPADVAQRWTRRIEDRADVLEGLARATFAAGVRVVNVHVGVCPPFLGDPEVFTEAAQGPDVSIKVAEALPFGLRLEVRLVEQAGVVCDAVVAVVARAALPDGS
jgi:hypothetical protein